MQLLAQALVRLNQLVLILLLLVLLSCLSVIVKLTLIRRQLNRHHLFGVTRWLPFSPCVFKAELSTIKAQLPRMLTMSKRLISLGIFLPWNPPPELIAGMYLLGKGLPFLILVGRILELLLAALQGNRCSSCPDK